MLGSLRFLLAILVLLSHANGVGFKINLGVVAVIIFYFISGYLMQRSYARFLCHSSQPVLSFVTDRILKLFPQYVIVVLASFSAIACLGPAQQVLFMGQEPNLEKIFLNLSLLPANYVFAPLAIEEMLPHPIVPPAWSLATEFHFYLLLPLVFLLPRRGLILLFGVAAFIQISAMFFADGWFNSNNFGYRYIFGVLTFFLFGYVCSRRREPGFEILARIIWFLYVSLFLIMAPAFGLYDNPQVMEVILGAVLAWPLVEFALAASLPKAWMQRADSLLGRLAYPIFISHFLSFYFCEKLLGLSSTQQIPYIPVAIAFCLTISYGLLFMQERIDAYRLSRRGFQSMATLACGSMTSSSLLRKASRSGM